MKETLKKQRLFFISLIGIVVVSLIMGTTFAYQTITMNEDEQRGIVLQAGKLEVSFETTNVIENINMPLLADYTEADYLEFTVDNTESTADAAFKISLVGIEYGFIEYEYIDSEKEEKEIEGCITDTCISSEDFKYLIEEVDTDTTFDGDFSSLSKTSPYTSEYELTNYNTIEQGATKTYRLYLWLQETEDNQNVLENTYFKGKISITSLFKDDVTEEEIEESSNPFNEGTLAYEIIDNALLGLNGTKYVDSPPTKVAIEPNSTNFDWEYGEIIYKPYYSPENYLPDYELSISDLWYWSEKMDFFECYDSNFEGDSCYEVTKGGANSCEELIGYYFYEDYGMVTGYVDACVDGVPAYKYKTESVISVAEDDTGKSYYFRGEVKNNYVNFANMCWRIVRIEGDESIKLILAAQKSCEDISDDDLNPSIIGTKPYGWIKGTVSTFTAYYANFINGETNQLLNSWYNTNLSSYSNKLKTSQHCIGNIERIYDREGNQITEQEKLNIINGDTISLHKFNYDAGYRLETLKTPTLKCPQGSLKTNSTQISLLTADEIIYAGLTLFDDPPNNYLADEYDSGGYWLLTIGDFGKKRASGEPYSENPFQTGDNWLWIIYDDNETSGVRPVISLLKDTMISSSSGDGTQNNPYVVE